MEDPGPNQRTRVNDTVIHYKTNLQEAIPPSGMAQSILFNTTIFLLIKSYFASDVTK